MSTRVFSNKSTKLLLGVGVLLLLLVAGVSVWQSRVSADVPPSTAPLTASDGTTLCATDPRAAGCALDCALAVDKKDLTVPLGQLFSFAVTRQGGNSGSDGLSAVLDYKSKVATWSSDGGTTSFGSYGKDAVLIGRAEKVGKGTFSINLINKGAKTPKCSTQISLTVTDNSILGGPCQYQTNDDLGGVFTVLSVEPDIYQGTQRGDYVSFEFAPTNSDKFLAAVGGNKDYLKTDKQYYSLLAVGTPSGVKAGDEFEGVYNKITTGTCSPFVLEVDDPTWKKLYK